MGKQMGRPRLDIDWELVNEYLAAQCQGTEIADLIGIAPDTLYRRCEEEFKMTFTLYSQQKKSAGKAVLRKKQWEMALNGDRTMAVWLGKQVLGQRDKIDNDVSVSEKVQPVIVFNNGEDSNQEGNSESEI